MAYETERRVAIEAVIKACQLCRTVRANLVTDQTMAKKDKSPVTVADFGAQAVVSTELMRFFPNDPLVGEEDSSDLRTERGAVLKDKVVQNVIVVSGGLSERQILAAIDHGTYEGGPTGRHWTLDPIDGTKGFLRGDQYAVALALIEDGKPVLGVLGCPNMPLDAKNPDGTKGCLFIAVKGESATMRPIDNADEKTIATTEVTDPVEASFCESVESAHSSHSDAARIAEILGVTAEPYRIDSQCKYAAVARGDASIYLRLPTKAGYQEKIWDHAAGWTVINQAGGQVTDVRGVPLDFSSGRTLRNNLGVVATNGKLHEKVITAVRQVLELS
ncbi:MAG: 3'(2'),5'-bisphosphate nucleotidase [Planctomycetota bacterium]|nr:MAG: 3'(2'),5'-bisphosphate nucleotidase [Planctomycetota bacterium]